MADESMAEILRRGDERQGVAYRIIDRLDLLGRWSAFGRPVIVGSVAYGLVGEPDIDLEIYSEKPRVEAGFAVVSALARIPGVWKGRFSNELAGPDAGLYWQVRYRDPASPSEVWKIDMWLLAEDHPGPRSSDLVEAMRKVVTPETRAAILCVKEACLGREEIHGIDVYRAVIDGRVRTVEEYKQWLMINGRAGLMTWRPT